MSARNKALAAVIELEAQGLFPKGLDVTLAANELEAVIEDCGCRGTTTGGVEPRTADRE